jgi:hypothetical protein
MGRGPLKDKADNKRPYKKPSVRRVRLVAEEAVLATCKIGSAGGFTLCQSYGEACGGYQGSS